MRESAANYWIRLCLQSLLAFNIVCRVVSTAYGAESTTKQFLANMKIAVSIFAQNAEAKSLTKVAQSRLEEILMDNGIMVLDEEQTSKLKDIIKTLDDPGVFVTAETFVENSRKFSIDGLLAVYLSANIIPGIADFYSSTAHADIRLIDSKTARPRSFAPPPMGARGYPPSDGLTRNSAAINAVQRAIDHACSLTGFEIAEHTRPKVVDLELSGPVLFTGQDIRFKTGDNDRKVWELAPLEQQTWRKETPSCTVCAPAGNLAAVGGYIVDTDFHRRPAQLYGSRVHLVDTASRKSILTLECSPVEKKMIEEKNTKKVLAIVFLGSWRHLCAATGNHLFMWDTENGRLLSKMPLPSEPTGLKFDPGNGGSPVLVQTKKGVFAFQIIRKKS